MGADVLWATVKNATEDLWLSAVDGNNPGAFIGVGSGETSNGKPGGVLSIDAFGAYSGNAPGAVEVSLEYGGRSSSWWKTPDGCVCIVYHNETGYHLSCIQSLPFFGPKPSTAKAWGHW